MRFFVLFLGISAVACTAADTSDDTDTAVDTADANAECTTSGFEPGDVNGEINGNGWFLTAENVEGTGGVLIESWTNYGGPTTPGVYDLQGYNYQECGLCVLLGDDCVDGNCATIYYAHQGTVEILSADVSDNGSVSVALKDVVFTEVTISDDYVSTPVEDARTWCVDQELSGNFPDLPNAGDAMPDLTAPDQAGNEVSLSDFQGTMLTLLFNANDWCPYCVNESATSEALWQEMNAADDRYDVSYVQLLYDTVAPYEGAANQEDAAAWADEFGITYPVLHGDDIRTYFEASGLGAFPCYWIVDPLGEIRATECGQGSVTSDKVLSHFEAFLTENPDWTRE